MAMRVSPSSTAWPARLARLAQLDFAVDFHGARGDDLLGRAAAIGETCDLQEVVQFDVVAGQGEIDVGHGGLEIRARGKRAKR